MNYGIGQLPYDTDAKGVAEHHLARQPVGQGRQVGRGIQARRRLLQLPVEDGCSSAPAREVWLPAGHARSLRSDKKSGFKNPAARRSCRDDGQGPDRQLEGRSPAPTCRRCATSRTRSSRTCWLWQGTAQQALDNAVQRGNAAIKESDRRLNGLCPGRKRP